MVLNKLLSTVGAATSKGVTYDSEGKVVTCLFCRIAAGQDRQTEVKYVGNI